MSSQGKQTARYLLFSLFLSFFYLGSPGLVVANNNPIDRLVNQAMEQELYRDRYWHILLHYRTTFSGTESLIDDPRFFLAKDGKWNPQTELEATIRSFFEKPEKNKRHSVCRFIARFEWLKSMLPFNEAQLPFNECTDFNRILAEINPATASLIFPTSHMNSPASMFGHTLLTVDTANQSKLVSYAINYAAVTEETFGPAFAVKGLFGFYKGYFSILPYYTKLQEYSDIDHRNIWEYSLNLNFEEIRRMLLHLYELNEIYSHYFFFDENCSYILLFLLEAARPELRLVDQCKWWVVPLDTVKLVKTNGLVTSVNFRPSKTTKIRHIAKLTSEEGQQVAISIAEGKLEPHNLHTRLLDPIDKIRAADLAIAYLQYRYAQKELSKESYLSIFLPALESRSSLSDNDMDRPEIAAPAPPDIGHHPSRLSLAVGFRNDDFFQQIKFRPVNHALLDDDTGYRKGAQIEFMDTAFRYYPEDNNLVLNYIDIIDITSISPRDKFFQPVSWKVATGLTRKVMSDENESIVTYLKAGGGIAYDVEIIGLWYGILVTDIDLGNDLDQNYAIGAGIETGIIRNIGKDLKCHLYVNDSEFILGDTHNEFRAGLSVNYSIKHNKAFGIKVSRTISHNSNHAEGLIYWNVYF